MRLQLVLLTALTTTAAADGTIAVRGVYYKERATRVIQPMLDGVFEAGERGLVTAHFLVDAITSASSSAGAANSTAFTENRYEVGGGYAHEDGALTVGGEGKYSTESDYVSLYAGFRLQVALAQKNTTLGLGGGVTSDTISAGAGGGLSQPLITCAPDDEATASCGLTTYSLFVSATQVLSPVLVAGVSADLAKLDGFQSNPYRQAVAGDQLVPERHPTARLRESFAGLVRYFVKPTSTALIGAYRYYRDDWKVHGHTPELRVVQQLGATIDASARYRYHTQDGAFFYRERYPAADVMLVSDDVKLSTMSTHTLEAKLGILGEAFDLPGRWAGARFEAVLQYAVQYNRFGNAIVAHFGLTVPLAY
jgi:hypothetical protein